jgi:hypothetical protein
MASNADKQKAKEMAAKGKSAEQIQSRTGVGSNTANRYVERQAPAPSSGGGGGNNTPRFSGQVTGAAREAQSDRVRQTLSNPQVGQRPGQVATVYAPGVTPPKSSSSNSSRSTPEIKGVGQGLRIAGKNGISKGDFKTIAKATGKDPEKIIGKLDKINTKLETKGKTGIDLKSGTGNMLVKNAQKYSDRYSGYRSIDFGEGPIGSTLQSMLSTPANAGTWIQGRLTGGREADPGFNPGGSPDKNRMTGGTVIRPSGGIANKGVGEQYKLPKRFSGEDVVVDNNDDEDTTNTDDETTTKTDDETTNTSDDLTLPTGPEGEVDRSASSGAGGLDLASWATGFRKARSARQKSGRSAQGLASQKKNPFKSWA